MKILPLQVPPSFPILHRVVNALAGAVGLLWMSCASAPPRTAVPGAPPVAASPVPVVKAESSVLKIGVPVERSLTPGQPDVVPLDLEAGVYLRLGFHGRGAKLNVSLLGPGGEVVAREEGDTEGRLAWITKTAGAYRLAVASPKAKVESRYQVTLLSRRQAIPEDGKRLEADAALLAARQETNPAKAFQHAQAALDLWSGLQDPDGTFDALDVIPSENETAIDSYTKALEHARRIGNRAYEARALTDLGEALTRKGKVEEAQRRLDEAVGLWRALGDSYQKTRAFYYRGFLELKRGSYPEVINLYNEALESADRTWDITLEIFNVLGQAYGKRGDNHEALKCFERALQFTESVDYAGGRAVLLTASGALHWRRGEARKALSQFDESLRLNQSDPGLALEAGMVLSNMSNVYLGLGQPEVALENSQKALDVFRDKKEDTWTAKALVSLGRAHLALGHTSEALGHFNEALGIASRGEDPQTLGSAFQWLGVAQLQLREAPQAVDSLGKALEIQDKVDLSGQAFTRQKLGEAYQVLGNPAAAREAFDKALEITKKVEAVSSRPPILLDLARLYRQENNFEQSLSHIEEAIEILETVRSDLTDDRLRTSFFASRRSYYDFYVELLMELDRLHPGQGYADRAFGASQKGKARSLLDLLARSRSELTKGISPELKRQEEDVEARLAQIRQDLVAARSDVKKAGIVGSLEEQLSEFGQRQQEIANRIRNDYSQYAQLRYPSPLQRQEIQKLLQPDEALLEFSLGEEKAYLFVITIEGISSFTMTRRPAEIVDDVETLRKSLEKGTLFPNAARQASGRLYEDLISPAVQAGLRGKSRLLIAPDGALHHLAFEALREGEGHLLIEDWAISYIPSASVLPTLHEAGAEDEDKTAKQFIAFAPVYGEAALQEQARGAGPEIPPGSPESAALPELEGAQEEVSEISKLYPDSDRKVYAGPEASCKAFKEIGSRTRALHYAGHGTLDEEHPEQSSLELSDGKLRVDDIFNLELKADLVVLSACKTAGKVVTGEGLVGLTRAFLYAGAPSVVVTLWQAVDTTTRDLMVQFYQNLGRTGDKAEALRQAKLSLIRQGRKPYYWAPFILVGKSR